ncbi:MAG: hypothetical protein HYY62_06075 [Deltaproteobacteria bacterium]|nr:hypothetical protein [Deltaproteobacteria bacterium]
MNFKKILTPSFLVLLFLGSGCAVLQEMGDDTSGRHYTSKSFSLPPGSTDSVTFNVNTQGSISASLSTRGLASSESGSIDSMMMALQSPGDMTIAQSEGNPHERLKLRYRVPRSEREGVWKVTLTNKSERTISGTLKVYYPYEDMGGGRTTSSETTSAPSQTYGYGGEYGSCGGYGSGGGYYNEQPSSSSSSSGGNYGSGGSGGYDNSGGYYGSGGGQQAPSSQTTSSGYGTAPAPASQPPSQTQTQAPAPSQSQQTPQPSSQRKILVVNPSVLRAAAVKPVQYTVKLGTFDLSSRDKRDKFFFNVRREGTIDIYIRWDRDSRNRNVRLAAILNGPAQENALARKDGLGNIHLQYRVKQSDIVAGRQWKVTVARFDEVRVTGNLARDIAQSALVPVEGNVQIRYPRE